MHIVVWAAVTVLAVQAAPPSGTPLGEAYFRFIEGRALEDRGDVEAAIRAYRRAAELAPAVAEIRAELAGLFARHGRVTESLAEGQAALAIDPDNREANRVLGLVSAALAGRGDAARRAEAIAHLERAVAGDIRDPSAEFTLGRLYVEHGRYDSAIARLTRFLLDQVGYPDALELLADAYEQTGRFDDALRTLDELPEGQRADPRVRSWRAELLESTGRWVQAAAAWQQVAESDSVGVQYPLRQASALANGGDLDGARRLLTDTAGRAPGNVSVWYLLAQVEGRAGNAAAARAAAERIRAVSADDPRGLLALADAHVLAGEPEQAVALLTPRVDEARPADVDTGLHAQFVRALAVAWEAAGDHARAVAVAEVAASRRPDDSGASFDLAAAYDRAGRFADAERTFRGILARDPGHAPSLNYLGYLLADRGERLDEAVALITRALDVERGNPSFLDSLGWAHFKRGDFERARGPLEQAASQLPRTSVIQDHLGDLYVELKQYRDAVLAFDRALSGDRRGIDAETVSQKRDRARAAAGGR
ncbi:MAG TPA: tetratricopeptide repeat protein [Vicinamibacterales bacterium]|nr:tetratricopeptide repeat protein [Vicinamibacterales bacterium]